MVSQSRQNPGTLNAVKVAFLDCFSTSTGHSLPQIAKPGNRFLRVMWALLFDNGAPLDNIMFAFSGTTGSARLYIRNSNIAVAATVFSSQLVNIGEWTHMAVSVNGSVATYYLNGTANGTLTGKVFILNL